VLDDSNITTSEYIKHLKIAKDAGYLVSVVDMVQPDISEAQKKNAYGLKEDTLMAMAAKWEPFVQNKLKEKSAAIQENADEDKE